MFFWPRLDDPFVCLSPIGVYVSFSWTDAGLCIYYLFIWSNFSFLHISRWITLPNQSCLVLYSFCANLLHSLIMWLLVSSLSPHNLHLLFCLLLFTPWEFSISALADGISLEFEWQQVFSSLQDSSQYSGCS